MPLESMSSISQRSTSIISQIPTMRFKVSEVRSLTLGGEFKTSRTTHASNIDHDSKRESSTPGESQELQNQTLEFVSVVFQHNVSIISQSLQ